jgi:hypothetical protein
MKRGPASISAILGNVNPWQCLDGLSDEELFRQLVALKPEPLKKAILHVGPDRLSETLALFKDKLECKDDVSTSYKPGTSSLRS